MQLRKLRRKVARAYELKRHLLRGSPNPQQVAETANLCQHLNLDPQDPELLEILLKVLGHAKQELQSLQTRARNDRIKAWQHDMANDPKALGRWLKSRDAVPVTKVQSQDGPLQDSHSIASGIQQYWQNFWRSNQEIAPEEIADRLAATGHCPTSQVDWEPPTEELL